MDRTNDHPILTFEKGRQVAFTFEGRELTGYEGETIAAALHAAGVRFPTRARRSTAPEDCSAPSATAPPV